MLRKLLPRPQSASNIEKSFNHTEEMGILLIEVGGISFASSKGGAVDQYKQRVMGKRWSVVVEKPLPVYVTRKM